MSKVVRDYWNTNAEQFDAIYSREKPWLLRWMDAGFRWDMRERFARTLRIADTLRAKGAESALDIGCGPGRFVVALAKQGFSRVVGVDVAPRMIELARQAAKDAGVEPQCEFVVADSLKGAPGKQFDLVLAIGLFDYLVDPVPMLHDADHACQGTFVSTWPRGGFHWRVALRKIRLTLLGCPVYFYKEDRVRSLLSTTGFRVESITRIGTLHYAVATRPAMPNGRP
jgi:2-polyprenyl-3-methyl-5-hydroxy-6-metoxy-1,4-benzoquinol methylase